MAQKTKKQHYVPQFYLNAWRCSPKHQIYVYDKEQDSVRVNNIQDVASERYFYDIDPTAFFKPDYLETLHRHGFLMDETKCAQILERAFADELEKPFSNQINSILDTVSKITPWYYRNCYFISEEDKQDFAAYLAIQFVRTKQIRNGIHESAECLTQAMRDMGFPESKIAEYAATKESSKGIHLQMILDAKNLAELTLCFSRLTWMLGINRTKDKLFTSDTPIVTRAHVYDPIRSMDGVASRGVEVFFPLSPEVILIMFDGSFHSQYLPFERKYIEIQNSEEINGYNWALAARAGRFVFSADGNMVLLDRMKAIAPGIFKQPHTQLEWGGKTYYPKSK